MNPWKYWTIFMLLCATLSLGHEHILVRVFVIVAVVELGRADGKLSKQ